MLFLKVLLSGLYLSDNGFSFKIVENHSITVSIGAGSGETCSFHSSLLITRPLVFLVPPPAPFFLNIKCDVHGAQRTLSSQRCCCSMQGS